MDLAAVLAATYPGALWSESGNDYATLSWDESNAEPKPTKAKLEKAWAQVQQDLKWADVRAERDRRLSASDWTQIGDAPVDAAAWARYRQELRDIPQNWNDPDLVEWPEEP